MIRVAIGILEDDQGRILLQKRRDHQVYAGHWEFPGGKIEDGETPALALERELKEEIAISPALVYPWVSTVHNYKHGTVQLNLFRVAKWQGEPLGRENQQIIWTPGNAPPPSPMLPANGKIWKWLSLPQIYAISNISALGLKGFMRKWRTARNQGVGIVQIRDKDIETETRISVLKAIAEDCGPDRPILMFNGDPEVARRHGAHGVHLDAAKLTVMRKRPELEWVGASCHSLEELLVACDLPVDYALLSPVKKTSSHPNGKPLGWKRFAEIATQGSMPVYALGGLSHRDLEDALEHGAHGIAMLSRFWNNDAPVQGGGS